MRRTASRTSILPRAMRRRRSPPPDARWSCWIRTLWIRPNRRRIFVPPRKRKSSGSRLGKYEVRSMKYEVARGLLIHLPEEVGMNALTLLKDDHDDMKKLLSQ